MTWDLVDVVAADAIRLCDEGLAMEIDHDELLAPAPDGTSASDDFGDLIVSDCYIPQIVYSTTFGYRTDMVPEGAPEPERRSARCSTWKPIRASARWKSARSTTWNGRCCATACPRTKSTTFWRPRKASSGASPSSTRSRTDVIWWSAGADTPQLLADGEVVMGSTYNGRCSRVIEEQDQPVAMLWDAQVFDLDGWIIPDRPAGRPSGPREGLRAVRHRHPASGRPGQVHLLRPGPRDPPRRWSASTPSLASRWRRTCRPTRRTPRTLHLQLRVLG